MVELMFSITEVWLNSSQAEKTAQAAAANIDHGMHMTYFWAVIATFYSPSFVYIYAEICILGGAKWNDGAKRNPAFPQPNYTYIIFLYVYIGQLVY